MKLNKLSKIVPLIVFTVLALGLIFGVSFGTISGFGWDTISALCPLGAITTMLSTKTLLPRAIVSLVVMAVLVFFLSRAFCGWVCPIPVMGRIKRFFTSARSRKVQDDAKVELTRDIAKFDLSCGHDCASCGSCKQTRKKLDSRHYVLGGALLSTVVFGFPVFCLFCPVGLTLATVLLLWRLFAFGDLTISVILVPTVLVVELLVLRKWCTRFCPLAALMNLVGRFGKFTRPVIDESTCIETTTGKPCSKCAIACNHDINLRHPDFGERREVLRIMKDGTLPHFVPDRRERLLDGLTALGKPTGKTIASRLWGSITIDRSKCVSCRMCATFCPTGAIARFDEKSGAMGVNHFPGECVKCGTCRDICPASAIVLHDEARPLNLIDGAVERYRMRPRDVELNQPHQILETMRGKIPGQIYER